jgi:uncharacterized protein DUF3658
MDRNRAAEIQKHLLDASDALDRATEAMFKLDKDKRKVFAEILFEVHDALHFGLLRALYSEHPELKPPEERPHISSTLRWEEVSLPDSISEADIDAVIFEALTPRLQKTAMVIAKAFRRCQEIPMAINAEMLGARIQALAKAGRIEGAGDLRMWRHSEVRARN